VYIESLEGNEYQRSFAVYLESGEKLGEVEQRVTSISTHIKGTRLRREGKRRPLWFVKGRAWDDRESQADAIRVLLSEAS
jgi:hypothetical protein